MHVIHSRDSRASSEGRAVERVVCLRLRPSDATAPREVLLLEDCVVAVYEDDRAVRFPSLDVMLRAHRLDVADLELAPD
jgi:hypothetical protein